MGKMQYKKKKKKHFADHSKFNIYTIKHLKYIKYYLHTTISLSNF